MIHWRALSAVLGVSRTPIRGAIRLLENEGWIESGPCKGTRVKVISEQDITEVFQMRIALESLAVELFVEGMCVQNLRQIKDNFAAQLVCVRERDSARCAKLDRDFHLLIAQGAGNGRL